MSELTAFNAYCKSNGINANGQLATEDLAPAFSAGYKARQDTLRQRVAELEAVLVEAREALAMNIVGKGGRTPATHEAIAKIDEVLKK